MHESLTPQRRLFTTMNTRTTPHRLGMRPLLLLLAGSLAAYSAVGCGGHSSHHNRGSIRFTVAWPPAETRVIPAAAQSLLVKIKDGSTVLNTQLIARPASTTTFTELPVGPLTVDVSAFASTDGTGTPLASASVPTTIVANGSVNVDVTLVSSIDHLEISPSPLTLAALTTGTITMTAKDVNGSVVLVDPSSVSYSSSDSSVASVSSSGVVTAGGSVGTATITVTEADSGKQTTVTVNVVPAVSVSPTSPSMTLRATQQFTATVTGPANTAVTWSVQEGSSGGTITAGGLYTAPTARGTYHVVATSVADTSRKAIATVTVNSGSANVSVH